MLRFADIRMKPKLVLLFLMTGALPLIFVGWLGTRLASHALTTQAFEHLRTVQHIKAAQIGDFFREREDDLRMLAESLQTAAALQELEQHKAGASGLAEHAMEARVFQAVRSQYLPYFTQYVRTFGYHDVFLVSREGQILFSTRSDAAPGTMLAVGPLADSNLADVWRQVTTSFRLRFVDFAPFTPGGGIESAFMGHPVFAPGGELLGMVAVQLSPDTFESLMRTRQGMGERGESYIIARDADRGTYAFRSSMQTMGGGSYVIGRVLAPTPYWIQAFQAGPEGGAGQYLDSEGTPVLVAYTPLHPHGLDWALLSKMDVAEVTAPAKVLLGRLSLAGGFLLLAVAVGSFLFTRRLVRPIDQDVAFAQAIADGDLSAHLDLDQRDELGTLARTLNRMAGSLRDIDWLARGKQGLDDALRGVHDPEDIARRFITYFASFCQAQVGAVYVRPEGADFLDLVAGYAFSDRQGNLSRFAMGQGLVGQVALERQTVVFSQLGPGEAPPISSGLDERVPPYTLIAPVVHEAEVLGVVLLGATAPFTPLARRLVAESLDNLAVHFLTARSHQVIQDLLDQAQEQAEALRSQQDKLARANEDLEGQAAALRTSEAELQAQQEELRVTNEELEEQTRALKASEEKLQAQQEELRVTNEELEERTKALEKQRSALRQKNIDLLRAQDLIEQKAHDLEVASKYKSEFLANMSHELRTPLNSILILSQLLADNAAGNLTPKQVESARAVNSSGADLLSLINEILDLSKVESGKVEVVPEELPVRRVTADLSRIFAEIAADKGVAFVVDVAENVPPVLTTDAQRLQQVLRNLISNAFKFTEQGSVTLAIARPAPEANLAASGLVHASALAFAVTDTGIGIPEDKQAVIFEAFQQADGTTSRKYGGTGLGLSISRELARLLGGELQLQSAPGQGSTFTLFLPETYTAPEPAPGQEQAPKTRAARARAQAAPERAVADPARAEAAAAPAPAPAQKPRPAPAPEAQAEQAPEPRPAPAEAAEPTAPLESTDQIPDDRKSIKKGDRALLIVEDDPNFARILVDMAHDRGFKCLVAGDGETGLHFADYYRPSAVVLDIGLPGIDGWTVMDRLKSNPELRHIPVHFMSAADETLDAMRMGAVGYLTKPVTLDAVNKALARIEGVLSKPVKRLLVVEDDKLQRESIRELIGNGDVETVAVETGEEAYEMLETETFDCMILDLGLKDMSGFELLRRIRNDGVAGRLPIIVYTGRELSREEEEELSRHAESIIIKGARSPERLLDETTLFLHRVEANLPEDKQRMLRMVHDKEAMLAGKKILLVDDDMRNVFALSSALEAHGMEVAIARNGREGVEKLSANPETDLVLMDIMMPEMDGYEAMRAIRKRKRFQDLPIIALTAKAMKGDRNKCIEAGASDYMAKPVDTDKLFSLLRVWLYR
ncbi:response regulator [Desulfocurvus vexinensis]|uniref:response regulator n=1 Tax=Desulfocurvus vexinensis TaxID=399548 RepID=UPI00048F53E0|nr:response regulator [Desulfocurvus vexinensis]